MKSKLVIDATIIIKWLNKNKEEYLGKADEILYHVRQGSVTLYAPEFTKYQISQVLLRNKKLSQTEYKTPLNVMFNLPVQFVSLTPELAKNAYSIADAYSLSFGEAVYIALCEELGATYVTEDFGYKNKGIDIKITELKNYK